MSGGNSGSSSGSSTSSSSDPGQPIREGTSFMGDIQGFMEQLNRLMENPMVQKRIQQQAQGGNNAMQAQSTSQPTQPQNTSPKPANAQSVQQQMQPEPESEPNQNDQALDLADVQTIEVFQAKILTEQGRSELVEGLEQLKPYLDEIGGGDATINDIQEHLQSEELQENIEQLRQAGLIE